MQHRPEYQLSSQSPVLTAKFHPFDTHVIIGGTYSGQVADGSIDIGDSRIAPSRGRKQIGRQN